MQVPNTTLAVARDHCATSIHGIQQSQYVVLPCIAFVGAKGVSVDAGDDVDDELANDIYEGEEDELRPVKPTEVGDWLPVDGQE